LARAEVAGAAPMTAPVMAALELEEVPMASMTHQLDIPMASKCSGPARRVESTFEAAKIHHLEVPTALAALQLQVPMAPAMKEVVCAPEMSWKA
jgi:hypothetical protein